MRFLVLLEVFDSLSGLDADRRLREVIGPHMTQVMGAANVKEAGFLADRRGAFLLVDLDAPEDLYALLGPEVYGIFRVQALPVAPLDKVAPLFEQWAKSGR